MVLYGSYSLSRPSLPDGPWTVHAEIAREMVNRNDWTTPYANGVPVPSTSRLLDWSIALSYKLFAVSDWAARLPLAVSVLMLTCVVFWFGRGLSGSNAAAFYAALFVLVWPRTFLATRELTPALFLTLGTTLTAFALWQLLLVRTVPFAAALVLTGLACALIIWAAGWPGSLLPLAIVALCWFFRRSAAGARKHFVPTWFVSVFLLEPFYAGHPGVSSLFVSATPPFALWLGEWLAHDESSATPSRSPKQVALSIFWIGLALAATVAFFAVHGPIVGKALQISAPGGRAALFIAAAALAVGVTGNLLFRQRNKTRTANCFLAGILGGLIVASQVGMVIASPLHSSQILAEAIRPELGQTDLVAIDGDFQDASSFAFYLGRRVLTANDLQERQQAWGGNTRVFLWTRTAHPAAVPGPAYVLGSSGGKEILSNRPNSAGAEF